jgi:hypothetical protein
MKKYISILPIVTVFVLSGISMAHAQVFTDNLYYGIHDKSQVSQLQEFLSSQGLYSGPITGNFYFLTLGAVKAFQAQQGIIPAAGYFGPVTMAAANKIADVVVGASNSQAISETGTSTPMVQGSSTTQLQLEALLQEVALLQQQLSAQQNSTQVIQNLQTQVQQQTQTIQQQSQALQQIASNTQPIASNPPAPPVANQTSNQLIASTAPLGSSVARGKSTVDNLGTITFSANGAGQVALTKLTVTFSGSAIATSTAASMTYNSGNYGLPNNITLLDVNDNDVIASDNANATANCTTQSSCIVTWIFSTGTGQIIIKPNSSYTFVLRINAAAGNGTSLQADGPDSLIASIQNASDLTFNGTASSMTLPTNLIPITINSVTYIGNPPPVAQSPVPPNISRAWLTETNQASTSLTFYLDPQTPPFHTVFQTLQLNWYCNLANSPNCTTASGTLDITNNTDANHTFTISGLSPHTEYSFGLTATNDGLTVSDPNAQGDGTSAQ